MLTVTVARAHQADAYKMLFYTKRPRSLQAPPWHSLLAQVARANARGVQEGHWVTEDEMWARAERHAAMPPPPPPGAAPSSSGKWGR